MGKFLTVVLSIITVILVGCSDKENTAREASEPFVVKASYLKGEEAERQQMNMSEGLIVRGAFWVEEKENIHDFLDAIETYDEEFFKQQFREGKTFYIDTDTRINCSNDTLNDGKIVKIKFLKGRYKNKLGYTYIKFVAIKKSPR